jgi:hypothetical protein
MGSGTTTRETTMLKQITQAFTEDLKEYRHGLLYLIAATGINLAMAKVPALLPVFNAVFQLISG